MREGRRAAPESLGLEPDRVVVLASFVNQERRMLHDGIHRGDRLPAALTGGVMNMKSGTRAMHMRALAKHARASRQSFNSEARGPALALAFQTLPPQRAIADTTESRWLRPYQVHTSTFGHRF